MDRRVMLAGFVLMAAIVLPTYAQDGAQRIGVVNVKDIFSNYKLAKQFEAEVEKEKQGAQTEINDIEKKMKDLMAEIQILEANSALRLEKEEELLQLDTLRKFKSERWKQITLKKINDNTAKIYNAIRDEVDAYAAEQGTRSSSRSRPRGSRRSRTRARTSA